MVRRFIAMVQVSDVLVRPDGEVILNEAPFPVPGEYDTEGLAIAAGERYAVELLEACRLESENPWNPQEPTEVVVSVVRKFSRVLKTTRFCSTCGAEKTNGSGFESSTTPRCRNQNCAFGRIS